MIVATGVGLKRASKAACICRSGSLAETPKFRMDTAHESYRDIPAAKL